MDVVDVCKDVIVTKNCLTIKMAIKSVVFMQIDKRVYSSGQL